MVAQKHSQPAVVPLTFWGKGVVQGRSLDLLLDLYNGIAAGDLLHSSRVVCGQDASDLMREDTAEANGAAPWVVSVNAAGDALRTEGEATLVDLWGEYA